MTNCITEFLKANNGIGAKNGIKATDILAAMGRDTSEDSKRYLKAEIRRYRLSWHENDGIENFIFSDTEHGYFLTENIDEIKRFVKSQQSRAIKSFETSKQVRKFLKDNGELSKGD